MTPEETFRLLKRIVRDVGQLDYPGRVWLMQRLVTQECEDVPTAIYLPSPEAPPDRGGGEPS